jgi:hypothetical protein
VQVEVNEENIVKYDLVRLTGNTKEDLLAAAARAEEEGYVLTCRIPEVTDVLHMNVFDAAEGRTPTDEEIAAFYHQASPMMTPEEGKKPPEGRVINVEFEGVVVDGEVVESHIEED